MLADSPLVLDAGDEPLVIIDESEKQFSKRLEHNARGGSTEDLTRLIHDQQKYRNTDDGYWIAQVYQQAAHHAIAGTVQDFRGALLTSDAAALQDRHAQLQQARV